MNPDRTMNVSGRGSGHHRCDSDEAPEPVPHKNEFPFPGKLSSRKSDGLLEVGCKQRRNLSAHCQLGKSAGAPKVVDRKDGSAGLRYDVRDPVAASSDAGERPTDSLGMNSRE